MRILTIGFTKKSAENFFGLMLDAGARSLTDVRVNNVSQLAGFAKRDDLRYFLRTISSMSYSHELSLAPTKPLLSAYRAGDLSWTEYEAEFLELLAGRHVERAIDRERLSDSVLLCSEDQPHRCHRRLVAEYLQKSWDDVTIQHL